MTTAWFHCFSGVAGDMALGSLVDAGADLGEVRSLLQRLPVPDWEIEAEPVLRGGIAGTKVHVHAHDATVVRTAAHIQGLVAEARLPERVQQRAAAVFHALAQAEGRLHRRPPDQVHFHEVGGIDAIVAMVSAGLGVSIVPQPRKALLQAHGVREVGLGRKGPTRQIALVRRAADIDNRNVEALTQAMAIAYAT